MKPWKTYPDILEHVRENYDFPIALNTCDSEGKWHPLSTMEVLEQIKYLTLGLYSIGIKKGDTVGLMSLPSSRWTIVDFAVVIAGGVLVPLFPNISEENFLFEIYQTEPQIIFIDSEIPLPLMDKHRGLFKTVVELSLKNKEVSGNNGELITYEQLLAKGRKLNQEQPDLYDQLEKQVREDDLAAIIYTSATTGVPKGVELTNKNLTQHLFYIPLEIKANHSLYLSILPLAHIFGHSLNMIALAWGAKIYYFNDIKNVGKACQEIHPTILVVVPRLLEKVYAKMQAAVHSAGFMKRHLGQWAFDLANQEEDSLLKYLIHPIVDKIVYSHLREALGGRLEIVVSGGAPLNPHLNHFYQEIGVPIYEGWGLTEACPIAVNRVGANKLGTVGKPFEGMELKISPEGEVLVRGSLTMRGYYKNPEASAKALDEQGWLHTGDKGEIDKDGFLKLEGRVKEIYKTSTGEWVAPVPIEQMITQAPLIEMAMVIAEGRKFTSCLLFPNHEVLNSLKISHKATDLTDEEFLNSEFVKKEMDKLFEQINKHLNYWEQVRMYSFVPDAPSIETGELTPSMKLRREVIMKKYQHLIDAMYREEVKV